MARLRAGHFFHRHQIYVPNIRSQRYESARECRAAHTRAILYATRAMSLRAYLFAPHRLVGFFDQKNYRTNKLLRE
jgi:hypothetical protein